MDSFGATKTSMSWNRLQIIFVNIFLIIPFIACGNNEDKFEKKTCSIELNGTGSFSIPAKEACDIYSLTAKNISSIISISLKPDELYNGKDFSSPDENIVLAFEEFSTFENETVVLNAWKITPLNYNTVRKQIYLSRTAQLNISTEVVADGHWSKNPLTLLYEEVTHETILVDVYNSTTNNMTGEITPSEWNGRYRPNCVTVFRILRLENSKASSIDITVKNINIDHGIGEYLLIGAGTGPFQGPPPLFIANNQLTEKKYKINDENGYVVFVSTSPRPGHDGFRIVWNRNVTTVSEDKDISTSGDDVLHSVTACIYNISAALVELKESQVPFKTFRETLAEIGSQYANNHSLDSNNINWSQVNIFRVSGVIHKSDTNEDLKEGALYVMIKVRGSEEGKAAFHWSHLEDIMEYYSTNYADNTNKGYKIGRCPSRSPGRPPTSSSIGFFVIILIMCGVFLLVWTWKYNPMSRIISGKMNKEGHPLRKSHSGSPSSQDGNFYVSHPVDDAFPKIRVHNDHGRQYTLNFEDIASSCAEEDSDNEIFNKMDLKKSQKTNSGSGSSSVRSSRRGSVKMSRINEGFVDDEGSINTISDTVQDSQKGNQAHPNPFDSSNSTTSSKTKSDATKL